MQKCPDCGEQLSNFAKVCKQCGRDLEPTPASAAAKPAAPAPGMTLKWGLGAILLVVVVILILGALF